MKLAPLGLLGLFLLNVLLALIYFGVGKASLWLGALLFTGHYLGNGAGPCRRRGLPAPDGERSAARAGRVGSAH